VGRDRCGALDPRHPCRCRRGRLTLGVAAGPNKVAPICAALRGRHVKAMVLDEATALGVLDMMTPERG
jgi:DNA-binding transcriptional regulator LsrR (DeoR family)